MKENFSAVSPVTASKSSSYREEENTIKNMRSQNPVQGL